MQHIDHSTRIENDFVGSLINVVSLLVLLLYAQSASGGELIRIAPGHQQILTIKKVIRATIGDDAVAAVETNSEDDQVIVTGLSMGKTDLTVWLESGKKNFYIVQIQEADRSLDLKLQSQLSSIEGLRVKSTNSGLAVEGQLYRSEDIERLQNILDQHPQIRDRTKVNANALDYLQQQMLDQLKQNGFDQLKISRADDTLYLEGFADSRLQKNRAGKIAKAVYLRTENHLEIGVENKNLILVDVKFMEILKNSLHNLGIQWPENIEINATSGLNGRSFSTVLSTQSTVALNALIEKGDAKVLSNPKLLCQSGFPASFDAGGEIPIRMISERTANVFFKSYGLHLDVSAKSDSGKRTSIQIQSRISDLDMATAIDGIPGILEHKVNTNVNLDFGQTVALAGLIETRNSKTTTKVPFLGHIPVLGELFKSRNFKNRLSEFVVFLTPILANGNSPYHMQQKNSMDQQWIQKDKDLQFKLND